MVVTDIGPLKKCVFGAGLQYTGTYTRTFLLSNNNGYLFSEGFGVIIRQTYRTLLNYCVSVIS